MLKFLGELFYKLVALLIAQDGTYSTSLAAMNSDSDSDLDSAVPEIWQKRIRIGAARKSFWGPMAGPEQSGKPIIEKDDLVNQAGDAIHINVVSELFGPGVEGESTARGAEDKISSAKFTITVDWLRKVVALTKKVSKEVTFDAVQTSREAITRWLARELDSKKFTQLLDNTSNTLYAGNATSAATLGDDDTFTTQELDKIKLSLDRMGALPLSVERSNGQETFHYGAVISEVDEYNLRGDDRWLEAVQYAKARGDNNPIFTGAPVEWNGLLVYTLRGVKAAGCVQGTPLRPESTVYTDGAGTALTDSATTILVGGAAVSATGQQKQYTKFFGTTGTIRIDSEEITYTGKTYRSFTGCTRACNGTVAAEHAEGSLITQRNISKIIGFGAEICAVGWGQQPQRIEDKDDYGFVTGLGIETLYGVKAIEDVAGNKPNYLVLQAFSKNPGSI